MFVWCSVLEARNRDRMVARVTGREVTFARRGAGCRSARVLSGSRGRGCGLECAALACDRLTALCCRYVGP